jgi:tetratricopeptide (TPR) repeat protein
VDCEQAVSLICARLDGELRREDEAGLEQHLAACPACRATAEAFALQDGDLRRAFGPRRRAATLRALQVADRIVSRPRPSRSRPDRALIRLAALVAGLAAAAVPLFFFNGHQVPPPTAVRRPATPGNPVVAAQKAALDRLVPQPVVAAAGPAEFAAGQSVETKAGERRRLALSQNTVVYLDQNTRFEAGGAGQGTLISGRVFVTGAPAAVATPDRTVAFGGGRCEIRSDGQRSGAFVVSGAAMVFPRQANGQQPAMVSLPGGYELPPGGWQVAAAPRATARLGWVHDLLAEEEAPLVPASSYAGGALVAVDANGQEAHLSLRKYHIDVHVEDGFARTTIDQTYFNHHPWRLEGTFYFPLPPDASLSRLAMYVDGKLMEGGMAERDHASRVYQQIVSSQRDPALLEWVDGSTFKMRVFPLEGRQEKRIILSYTQRLPDLYGKTTYRFPSGHSLQVARDWSFHARVKGGAGLTWGSPSHPSIRGAADGPDLVLTDEEIGVKADRDVVLELEFGKQAQPGKARFASAELDGKRYLMVRYRPELPPPGEIVSRPRSRVFLYESSADRDPLLARTQIEIIRQMLNDARQGDTFNVLTAGTRTFSFANEAQPVTPENVKAACEFLGQTHLIGALDLGRAFDDAAKLVTGDNRWLVHVGSGYTAIGVRQEELASHVPGDVRYVGIGVGKRWNRSFMKGLAEHRNGHFSQINPDEPIAWRVLDLTGTLDAPRLQGVTVETTPGQPGPVFLAENSTVCEGEELCAVARLATDGGRPVAMPRELTVRATRDGQPFSVQLPVPEKMTAAGYLPRFWARLEIERLLTAGAAANRDRVVELSKSMYVMSPFTSLLVLENDAMYAQFKVDRGRKDHWAMYPCPAEVPVVYEPDPTQPVDVRNAPKGTKPDVGEVWLTVQKRALPRIQSGSENADADNPPALELENWEARDFLSRELERLSSRGYDKGQVSWTDPGVVPLGDSLGRSNFPHQILDFSTRVAARRVRPQLTSGVFTPDGFLDDFDPKNALRGSRHNPASGFDPVTGRPFSQLVETDRRLLGSSAPGSLKSGFTTTYATNVQDLLLEDLRFGAPLGSHASTRRRPVLFEQGESLDRLVEVPDTKGIDIDRIPPLALPYPRPRFTNDPRLFSDLVAFAPGLNSSEADLQAILEAEAAPDLRAAPGNVDPAARQLIDRARSAGWQTLTIPGGDGRGDSVLTFDGAGRFVSERVSPVGLREVVVCDGSRLLHLYPELALGSSRAVSRFHRAELAELVPWLLPPAEDLARGADVRLVDDHTVAVVPNVDKPVQVFHLVFAAGRLAERQDVDAGSRRILLREVYDGTGVRWFNADGKEIGHRKDNVRSALAPDLKPVTSSLVLLPMPFRSRAHVFVKYHLNPSRPLSDEPNKNYLSLDAEGALQLLAATLLDRNRDDAHTLLDTYFGPRGDDRRGLFVVAAACGADFGSTAPFRRALSAHRDDPLLRYLLLQSSEAYQAVLSFLPAQRGDSVDGNGFLHRLAVLHDLTRRWEASAVPGTNALVRRVDMDRTVAFVRENPGWSLTPALLALVQNRLADNEKKLVGELADARGVVAARSPDYANRYEQARLLLAAGRKEDAASCFLRLYAKVLDAGLLPRIDRAFRDALAGGGRWGQLMRQTADRLLKANYRTAVIFLAWQCRLVDDAPLADSLLALALDHVPAGGERWKVTMAAVNYLRPTAVRQADELLRDLMSGEPFTSDADLWRLRTEIAGEMEQGDYAASCLERALDLEYRNLPAVIDLRAWRGAYKYVLNDCRRLAASARSLGVMTSPELVARVVRTADRWRSHDPEFVDACETAAATLSDLGEADLAWDYLTTAVAYRARGPETWHNLATARRSVGDRETAERAYAVACANDPQNARILWDRAQNLRSTNHAAAADALLRRLADEEWPAEYAPIRELAREQLRRR